MKILNLYACLGGNRYKWNEVKDDIEVTAVELDEELARLYQERFPNDKVIIADAHQYLLDHYKEYDFIWSSPPCPTHSKENKSKVKKSNYYNDISFPDYYDIHYAKRIEQDVNKTKEYHKHLESIGYIKDINNYNGQAKWIKK